MNATDLIGNLLDMATWTSYPVVEVADTVTIGKLGSVHWVVTVIQPKTAGPRLANLRSGLTGVHRYNVPVKKLHIYTKGTR